MSTIEPYKTWWRVSRNVETLLGGRLHSFALDWEDGHSDMVVDCGWASSPASTQSTTRSAREECGIAQPVLPTASTFADALEIGYEMEVSWSA